MSKRSTAYEKGESSKPLERPKTPGAYESSTLDNHNDAFVEDGSKDELGERTPTPIRSVPIVEPPSFTFPKDLLKARKIYDGFKPIEGYEKHVDTFFQYKIAEYENDGLTDADLQELVYDDFINIGKEHLRYAQKRTLLRFRKSLRRYGVYVNTKTDIETAVLEVISRDRYHEWTHHQLREYQRDESQPFVSAKWANIPVGIGSKTFDQIRPDERSSDRPNDRPPPAPPAPPAAPAAPAAPEAPRGRAATATVPESISAFEASEAPSIAANKPTRPRNLQDGLRGRAGPPPSSNGDSSDPDDSDHPNNGNGHVTMRNPDTYHMRIMTACDGVPECYSAICNPRSTATELINQIKQTIDSYQKTFPRRTVPTETFLTDRRFYNNTSNPTRKPYDKNSRYDRKPRQALTAPPGRSKDDCYFPGCKIKGCRYYKHTQEEKDRVKGEYRNKYSNLDDKSFKTRYDHFITDTGQGSDNDDSDEDDVGDRLIGQYLNDQDDDVEEISRTFFTSVGSYDAQKVAIALNNAVKVLQDPSPEAPQDDYDEVLDSITVVPPEGYTFNAPPRRSARNDNDIDQFVSSCKNT
ncbi:hypothetical protein H4I95_05731 [Botrytis cinerea]